MKAAIALAVSFSLLGCFPNNARHRRYAQWAEGGSFVAGIAIAAIAGTGADCDEMTTPGTDTNDCKSTANFLSTTGVVLILAGLLGFVVTVSTAEDDAESTPRVLSIEKTAPRPGTTDGAGSAAGSAAPIEPAAGATDPNAAGGTVPADGTAVPAPNE